MEKRHIEFVRGDTMLIARYFTDADGNQLEFNSSTDEINFTMRKSISSEAVVEKHIADITCVDKLYTITIKAEDTQDLDFGKYGYDIEIRVGDDYVSTVECGTIELLPYDYSRPEVATYES